MDGDSLIYSASDTSATFYIDNLTDTDLTLEFEFYDSIYTSYAAQVQDFEGFWRFEKQ